MALEVMVGFLGIGQSARSISRRVVKIACSSLLIHGITTPKKRLWTQNPKAHCVHDSKHWEWVGHGMHYGCNFGTRKVPIYSNWANISPMKFYGSTGPRRFFYEKEALPVF